MNKKIFVCAFSFFSMTLFCAEEHVKMEISRKRCQREEQWQGNKAKRVKKRQNQNQAGGINMEIISSDNFAWEDLKKILEEIEGSSISQEEMEQERKKCSSLLDKKEINLFMKEIELVVNHLVALRESITELQKRFNLQLLSTSAVDQEDGNSIIAMARLLQTTGQKEEGKKLAEIGATMIFWQSRKEQNLNDLIGKLFADPKALYKG